MRPHGATKCNMPPQSLTEPTIRGLEHVVRLASAAVVHRRKVPRDNRNGAPPKADINHRNMLWWGH